eukprot:31083-Pelagococcus_subviridis.AAC.2
MQPRLQLLERPPERHLPPHLLARAHRLPNAVPPAVIRERFRHLVILRRRRQHAPARRLRRLRVRRVRRHRRVHRLVHPLADERSLRVRPAEMDRGPERSQRVPRDARVFALGEERARRRARWGEPRVQDARRLRVGVGVGGRSRVVGRRRRGGRRRDGDRRRGRGGRSRPGRAKEKRVRARGDRDEGSDADAADADAADAAELAPEPGPFHRDDLHLVRVRARFRDDPGFVERARAVGDDALGRLPRRLRLDGRGVEERRAALRRAAGAADAAGDDGFERLELDRRRVRARLRVSQRGGSLSRSLGRAFRRGDELRGAEHRLPPRAAVPILALRKLSELGRRRAQRVELRRERVPRALRARLRLGNPAKLLARRSRRLLRRRLPRGRRRRRRRARPGVRDGGEAPFPLLRKYSSSARAASASATAASARAVAFRSRASIASEAAAVAAAATRPEYPAFRASARVHIGAFDAVAAFLAAIVRNDAISFSIALLFTACAFSALSSSRRAAASLSSASFALAFSAAAAESARSASFKYRCSNGASVLATPQTSSIARCATSRPRAETAAKTRDDAARTARRTHAAARNETTRAAPAANARARPRLAASLRRRAVRARCAL